MPDVLMRSSEGAVPHKMECPAEEKDGSKAGSATDMWAWERVELRFSGEDRTLSPFTTFIPKWNESAGKDCGSLVGSEFVPAVRLTTPDVPISMSSCHISRAPQRCKACRLLLATAASHPHCSAHYERAHVRSRLYRICSIALQVCHLRMQGTANPLIMKNMHGAVIRRMRGMSWQERVALWLSQ